MKTVLIVENSTESLKKDLNMQNKGGITLGGLFTEFYSKNNNNRIYKPENFLPAFNEMIEKWKKLGVLYGEFEHPEGDIHTSLKRASHVITQLDYVKEKNGIYGKLRLLNTHWGKEAQAIVNDGYPLFVSSRALGVSLPDGNVIVKKIYTYDIVADPGFTDAKLQPINESLGYPINSNFRIYELSEESKINEMLNMEKNKFATHSDLKKLYNTILNQLNETKKLIEIEKNSKNKDKSKLEMIYEYYDDLKKSKRNIIRYLDYLVDEINESNRIIEKLRRSNRKLRDDLRKAILFTEHVAGATDKGIGYSEYIAEKLDRLICYQDKLLERLNNNKLFESSKNQLPTLEDFGLRKLNEGGGKDCGACVDSEDDEETTTTINKFDSRKEFKKLKDEMGDESGDVDVEKDKFDEYEDSPSVEKIKKRRRFDDEDDPDEFVYKKYKAKFKNRRKSEEVTDFVSNESECDEEENKQIKEDDSYLEKEYKEKIKKKLNDSNVDDEDGDEKLYDEEDVVVDDEEEKSDDDLGKKIDELIEEVKKKKINEDNNLNFLKFLNKKQVDSFYSLSKEDQEIVKMYISDKKYFSQGDVLRLINEALAEKRETLEDRLIRLMPDSIKPIWDKLDDDTKRSIMSQAKLYPEEFLQTETQIEHFWLTRNLKKNESATKKLMEHSSNMDDDKLSDSEIKFIIERFKKL